MGIPRQCGSCGGACGGGFTGRNGKYKPCRQIVLQRCEHKRPKVQCYECLSRQLSECKAALDGLISAKPGIERLTCGSTTIGNLRAEMTAYLPANAGVKRPGDEV